MIRISFVSIASTSMIDRRCLNSLFQPHVSKSLHTAGSAEFDGFFLSVRRDEKDTAGDNQRDDKSDY